MTKIAVADQEDGLVKYQIGSLNGAIYAQLTDPAWIEQRPFKLNGKLHSIGETFTMLGTRPRRTFCLQQGHFIEYVGRIDDLLLFMSDGEATENWYYAFYAIGEEDVGGRLLIVTGDGAADIW